MMPTDALADAIADRILVRLREELGAARALRERLQRSIEKRGHKNVMAALGLSPAAFWRAIAGGTHVPPRVASGSAARGKHRRSLGASPGGSGERRRQFGMLVSKSPRASSCTTSTKGRRCMTPCRPGATLDLEACAPAHAARAALEEAVGDHWTGVRALRRSAPMADGN